MIFSNPQSMHKPKFFFAIFALLGCFSSSLQGQCPLTDVTLNTQTDVDLFIVQYPNCTHFTKSVTVTGSGISNLAGLANLQEVAGLYISSTSVQDLSGLASLSAADFLDIASNGSMTSLGLSSLSNCRYFNITDNDELVSLAGLEQLASVEDVFNISWNDKLVSLSGLDNLAWVGKGIDSDDPPEFRLRFNPMLIDLTALLSMQYVDGDLIMTHNTSLQQFHGLEKLSFVRYLAISNNPALLDLSGLEGLGNVEEQISISTNANLASLAGLYNLSNVPTSGIGINGNPKLSFCAVQPICAALPSSLVYASGNAPGCDGIADLQNACLAITPCFIFEDHLDIDNPWIRGGVYLAKQSIHSEGVVLSGSIGAEAVYFQAKNEVLLKPGFEVKEMAEFTIAIKDTGCQ